MAPKKERKEKEPDPTEILKRNFRSKCLFKRLVRLAVANAYWLSDVSDQYDGVDDVKKRVAQAMRKKTHTHKELLTLADKALLNKPANDRTDQERKYIYRIIGGLKCFKRYPNNVKKKLASVTYFKYYGPGRVIIRQHHPAHAMYFIVTGDVVVTQLVYDGLLEVDVPVEIQEIHAGDMFGEVSLLHNIPRTATCTTASHCELLVLMKNDFKDILQATLQASWDNVRTAMSQFSYFDELDEVSRREGCIVARMKSYKMNEVMLGDNVGLPNFVFFVLSGRCQMIESLKVIETSGLGQTSYTLLETHDAMEETENHLVEKYLKTPKGITEFLPLSVKTTEFKATEKSADKLVNTDMPKQTLNANENVQDDITIAGADPSPPTEKDSIKAVVKSTTSYHFSQERPYSSVSFCAASPSQTPLPRKIQTHFMQVCQFNPGSTFGFGENMQDRRIVAQTRVKCMLMPKIWLLQHNSANIWTRIRYYLDKKIPNKKKLFDVLKVEHRWEEFRNKLVHSVVSRCSTSNPTTLHDVPYSIRMEEMLDI